MYLMQHRNIDLYSCIAPGSQFLKGVSYVKQIIVITGETLERRAGGNFPRCPPPFIRTWNHEYPKMDDITQMNDQRGCL